MIPCNQCDAERKNRKTEPGQTATTISAVVWKEDSHGFNAIGEYSRHRCYKCPDCGIPPFAGNAAVEPEFMKLAWNARRPESAKQDSDR